MRIIVIAASALFFPSTALLAQQSDAGRSPAATSMESVYRYAETNIFSGISLSKDQVLRIHAIIDETTKAQHTAFKQPKFVEKRALIIAQRNAAFRALLKTDGERAKFDVNIKQFG